MAYPASSVRIILHGSRDPRYLRAVADFAESLKIQYSFQCLEPGYGIPLYVARGADYERAEAACASGVPPLMEWPGFVDFINELGVDLVAVHGSNKPLTLRGLKPDVSFIESGEPLLSSYVRSKCPKSLLLLILAPGVIMDKAIKQLGECRPEIVGPLMELPSFREYFRRALPLVIQHWRAMP
ncbi:hypothetical protein GCM10007981_08880 [Thermocladium modestius]|uniref:Uncharacterized protein n=1 Tax=Thermocladium modestius TaxID=62609 RepID=A0A830GVG3_9CREN|nr:hypothetical protein [Thermocladium modestius]GGP20508.1 hypothetical protein GCM10007981_08880 [Thermocladium modestius]